MNTYKALLMILTLAAFSSFAQANEEEGLDYNSIVNELSKTRTEMPKTDSEYGDDPLSQVAIHLGLAMTNTNFGIEHVDGTKTQATQRGIQAALGIDLLSPRWMAEGTMQNYFDREYEQGHVSLQEFDLKVFYKNRLDTSLGYRIGGGLAARYLTLKSAKGGEQKFTTPSSVAAVGLDLFINNTFSIGGEVSARNSLVASETPDQSSIDFLLRIDAHL
ncbi:MAG: hypothetical protein AB7F59_04890 [Bdellovibrionales bacterium]